MRLLVVEDEKELNRLLVTRLKAEHYSVDACFNGKEALEYLEMAEYDGIILDIMMPVMDGLTVLKKLRAGGNTVPVLLLTAKDSIEDRVKGLDAGAGDYLVKPFAMEELLARVRVLLRRPEQVPDSRLRVGTWSCAWIPTRCSGETEKCGCRERNSPFSGTWCRIRESCCPGRRWNSICGTMITREVPMSLTYTSAICGRNWMTGRKRN